MSDREAFEKWWPSVGQTIGKVAAWEAWQAAQAQTLLEVIRDDSGCPVEVRVAEAQQHSESEPVAWMSPNKQSLEFSRPDTVYGSHTIPLYTTPQPVVPEAVFDILKAAQGSCRLGLNDIAEKQIQIAIKALLSAGKGE
jgi:hypothetical protein